MKLEGKWEDLETRGFVVVRDFLPKELLDVTVADARKVLEGKHLAGMYRATPSVCMQLEPVVTGALAQVREHTSIKATDLVSTIAWYFNSPSTLWHTDPPPYYLFQNMRQYLNFWMPIVKPDRNDAGLMVVPMDRLAERDPAFYEALDGRGGAMFLPKELAAASEKDIFEFIYKDRGARAKDADQIPPEHLVYESNGRLRHHEVKVDIEEIAETPPCSAGDVVITRGDVLHKGQGNSTQRIALSLRTVNGDLPLHKQFVLGLSEYARRVLSQPKQPVAISLLGAYEYYARDTITAREVLQFRNAADAKEEGPAKVVSTIWERIPQILATDVLPPAQV